MRFAMVIGLGMLLGAAGCKPTAAGSDGGAATTAAAGCGADYGSPGKNFCVKAPAGYTPEVGKGGSLTTEIVTFHHPVDDKGHYPSFDIQVGWRSDPHKTYDEEVKKRTADLTSNSNVKMEGSGPLPNGGMWWQYKDTMERFESWAKTADGTPIVCNCPDPRPQDAMDACKSIRVYPK